MVCFMLPADGYWLPLRQSECYSALHVCGTVRYGRVRCSSTHDLALNSGSLLVTVMPTQ